ncbi:MAG: O-GlcNAc transferase [Planctomycetaceae bacterium]|nr:O-GlcNAc transferase [Planctomycetaceae bacterium]
MTNDQIPMANETTGNGACHWSLRFGHWSLAIVVFVTLLTYSHVIATGGFIWDDPEYIVNNEQLRTADGLANIWFDPTSIPQYYPLVHTTFWFEFQAWELNPRGYHIVNVLFHAANAALLFLLLKQLGVRAAFLAAAIFAVHPVHVESVAWITERKNVLSGLFYLLAFYWYWRQIVEATIENAKRVSWFRDKNYYITLGLFVLALLSKTVTASWPAAMLVAIWWKTGRLRQLDWLPMLPFFVIGLGGGVMTSVLESQHVGASGPDWDFSTLQRCVIAGRATWFYASKIFLPHPLIFIYPRWDLSSIGLTAAFPIAAVGLVVVLLVLRHRIGRGPLAAALLFGGTLVPALGFINVYPMLYSFVADHFQYLASISLIVLAASVWQHFTIEKRWAVGVELALLAVLAVLSWQQQSAYQNTEALWRDTVAKNPGAWMAHYNLANELSARGDFQEAIEHYQQVIVVRPNDAQALHNWARALQDMGQAAAAKQKFLAAIVLESENAEYYYNLANVEMQLRQFQEARDHYVKALKYDDGFLQAQSNLGVAQLDLARAGEARFEDARDAFLAALKMNPEHTQAAQGAAVTSIEIGKRHIEKRAFVAAQQEFERALKHAPNSVEALRGLGKLHLRNRSYKSAEVLFRRLLPMDQSAPVIDAIGQALMGQNNPRAAVPFFEKAAQLSPESAEYRIRMQEARAAVKN